LSKYCNDKNTGTENHHNNNKPCFIKTCCYDS